MQVRFDKTELDSLVSFLAGMENRVDDFSVPFVDAGRWMEDEVLTRILTGGASDGKLLPKQAESTKERDTRADSAHPGRGPHPLLQLSGAFTASVQRFSEKFAVGVRLGPLDNLIEWGTNAPVSFGSGGTRINTRRRGRRSEGAEKNPPRPVAWISAKTIDRIMKHIVEYAVGEN